MKYFTTIIIFFLVNIFVNLVLAQKNVFECKKFLPVETSEDVLNLRICLKEVKRQIKFKLEKEERRVIFEGSKKIVESKKGPYCIYVKTFNECRGEVIFPTQGDVVLEKTE